MARGVSERQVVCPVNPVWLEAMLAVLPPGLRGRLEPYSVCQRRPPRRASKVIHPAVRRQ